MRIGTINDGEKSEAYKYGKPGDHYLGCAKAFAEAMVEIEKKRVYNFTKRVKR